MIENIEISIPLEEVEDSPVAEYLRLSDLPGEFLLMRRVDDSLFYFLCTINCPVQEVCDFFDWYIVSNDKFNENMVIGAGLAGNDNTEGIIYRVRDENTLKLWKDILLFTFESDFIKQFFPYTNHFKGKIRIDGALCFYIHDYYPVSRHKEISTYQKKVSNLVFRFKEGKQSALVAKLFSLAIMRMPFIKELNNPILIPIPAATKERNIQRFAQFNYLLSKRIKVEDGFKAIWIKEDREQLKGTKGYDKLTNLTFYPQYYIGRDVLLIDDIFTTGDSFIQIKQKLVKSGARSVTGLFFGKTVSIK